MWRASMRPPPKWAATAQEPTPTEIASAVESDPDVVFSLVLPFSVCRPAVPGTA